MLLTEVPLPRFLIKLFSSGYRYLDFRFNICFRNTVIQISDSTIPSKVPLSRFQMKPFSSEYHYLDFRLNLSHRSTII
uniref:Ovule protein n=1 Tax=Parascaris univalens TaxID=6257 RepID=A0A915C099_PARUN